DRDNDFYLAWEAVSRDPAKLQAYLDEWVHGVPDRKAYMAKQLDLSRRLKAKPQVCSGVDYGF
ncbi:MAG: CoA transferase subunit A, partial [Elusimicrobiota bacterium]